ncbi:MAG: cadmium-translocating P-type ATPase, partial [Bacteroidia bacterium]|nr:cadmium-translocating P-type ATPase [Bacteroidia bacterium]NNM15083.1 cadmium-translocating P-type ATPase [Bacteroidia bacterium]
PLVQLVLSLPVMIIGLNYFGKSAWHSLKQKMPNMDVLITMGSSAAFIYSLIGVFLYYGTETVSEFLFFETAATIITLVLLGNVIEHRSVKKTSASIKELSKLQTVPARIVTNVNGVEKIVVIESEELKVNDIIQVNTGDRIASDGIITQGTASIDESMISGESLPLDKKLNDAVIGGTLIKEGSIRIKITAIKNKTVLAQIIELVKQARSSKPKIQLAGDKVSAIFVPVVISIAILTAVLWVLITGNYQQAMLSAIAVLVISCPCAMGLATPTAVSVGLGRAARNGILIKGGETVEKIAQLKTIVFDKTGTLTTGKFKMENFQVHQGTEQEAKEILLALEKNSSHPIAKSIVSALQNENIGGNLELRNVIEEKGIGIKAKDANGNKLFAGSAKSLGNPNKVAQADIYISKNNELIASFTIQDDLKEGIEVAFQKLKKQNIKTVLLSGDKQNKCHAVAEKLSIDEWHAEKMPHEKLEIIKKENDNALTAMVGDGINDAPSLSQASVGISLSNATQAAIDSSEVVLLNDVHMETFTKALQIGKHTYMTIKQNLFWAFFYNVFAIPIAAFGLLNPLVAALGMAFSDVVVIGNSLRLRKKKIFK